MFHLDLDQAALPPGWNDPSNFTVSQEIGDAWLSVQASLALKVPSAVIPEESNLLLAPGHADLPRLSIGKAQPFPFDPRLTI